MISDVCSGPGMTAVPETRVIAQPGDGRARAQSRSRESPGLRAAAIQSSSWLAKVSSSLRVMAHAFFRASMLLMTVLRYLADANKYRFLL